MRDFHDFVRSFSDALDQGAQLPLGGWPKLERAEIPPDAPRVVIFSPHPDDEMIIGALPLRLMQECGFRVVNIGVTLGSNKARQAGRQEELANACHYIGFDCVIAGRSGLENVNLLARREDPIGWLKGVDTVADLLRRIQPAAIFYPHASDANTTHIGVHGLVNHALLRIGQGFACEAFETEFWSPMDTPNVMVESSEEDVARLLAALSFHVGEVQRNPYHLTMPAWMIDNVRRGAERIGGQGKAAPKFRYATLYRRRHWNGERFEEPDAGRFIGMGDNPEQLLR